MNENTAQREIESSLLKIEELLFGKNLTINNMWDVWYHPTIRFLWDHKYKENNKIWYKEGWLLQSIESHGGYDMMPSEESGYDVTFLVHEELNKIAELDPTNLKNAYYSILAYIWDSTIDTSDNLRYFLEIEFKSDFENHPRDTALICLYGGYQRVLETKEAQERAALEVDSDNMTGFRRIVRPSGYKSPLDFYEEALTFDPDNPFILGLIGYCLGYYLNHERHEEAIQFYEKSLALNPADKYIWLFKAHWHKKLNEYSKELDCYIHILQIDSENLAVHKLMAECLIELKRETEALGSYEKIMSEINIEKHFFGLFPETLLALAPLYKELGQNDKAMEYLNKFLSEEGIRSLHEAFNSMVASNEEWTEKSNMIFAGLLEQKADLLETEGKESEAIEIRERAMSVKSLIK